MSLAVEPSTLPQTLPFVSVMRSEVSSSTLMPTSSKSPIAGKDFWIETFENIDALAAHSDSWQELADNTIETNPFYEPWMFIPAWRAFGHEATGTKFALIWQRNPRSNQPPILVGFVPLTPRRGFGGLPVRFHRMWQHPFCYLCAPLLRRGVQHEALAALLDGMMTERMGLLELHHVPAEGPFNQTLLDVTAERNASLFLVERYNRAHLQRAESAESYITASMSHHHQHELRRKQRRLYEMGNIEFRTLSRLDEAQGLDTSDLASWLHTFVEVEQLGWKGREESALGSNPVTREFFETVCREAHTRGRLMMLGMFLDGRPLAAKCNFLSGDGGYALRLPTTKPIPSIHPVCSWNWKTFGWSTLTRTSPGWIRVRLPTTQ